MPLKRPRRVFVLYDGLCPRCRRVRDVVRRVDRDLRCEFIDVVSEWPAARAVAGTLEATQALVAMQVIAEDGARTEGYDGFVTLCAVLDAPSSAVRLLRLGLVRAIGRRCYALYAARRRRDGPCRDHTCSLEYGRVNGSTDRRGNGIER